MPRIETRRVDWNIPSTSYASPRAIFLHGFAGTSADWEPARRALPLPSAAVDLPWHGASSIRGHGPDFESVSDELADLARGLGERTPTWIGYSFGARLLCALAARRPDAVAGVVLVSAHPGIEDARMRERRRQQDAADAETLRSAGLDAFLDAWHQRPAFDGRRDRSPSWSADVDRRRQTNDPMRLASCLERLGLGVQPPLALELRRLKVPILFVTGALDHAYTQLAASIVEGTPEARHVAVPGAGHAVHLEAPDAFDAALHRFFNTALLRANPRGSP